MDIFSLVIFICFYITLPIMYFILRNESKPKKNIVLGVTLPYAAREGEEVKAICKEFRKNLLIMLVVMSIFGAAGLFIPYNSVMLTYEMVWLIFALAVPFLVYAKANVRLKKLKTAMGWGGVPTAEAGTEISVKKIGSQWFVLPVIISLIPCGGVFFTEEDPWIMLAVYLCFTFVNVLCAVMYRIICSRAAESVDGREDMEAALTRVRKYNRGACFLAVSWLTGLYSVMLWLFWDNGAGIIISTAAYIIILLFACLYTEFRTRSVQERLTADSGAEGYTDDDSHWLWGIIYYNKNDEKTVVNSRVGMGTTVNMAKTAGKALVVFTAICLAAMPVLGIWTMAEEFTPVRTEFADNTVYAYHPGMEYSVNFDDIVDAEIITELPHMSKLIGTGMKSVLKGKFKTEGYGVCQLCLDPRKEKFIVISSADTTYIFNAGKAGEEIISKIGTKNRLK